jgi:hypothetical protein
MGICRHCHQKAGWFTDAHEACEQKVNAGIESVKKCMADAVIAGKQYSDVSATIAKLTTGAQIAPEQVYNALRDGWSLGAEQRSKAQPLSPEELDSIDKIWQGAGLKREDVLFKTAGAWAALFSLVIWTVLHDHVQRFAGPVSFNLQRGEIPVWQMPNVLLKQQCTTTSYVGGHSGVSMRVGRGLWYRFGGLSGHRVESTSLQDVDYGYFLMTTRAIYFGAHNPAGQTRGTNFRLPFNQIIRFQPYSDAVGICRSGAREQIFVPIGVLTPDGMVVTSSADRSRIFVPPGTQTLVGFPDCGWFLFNLLQALAARDSADQTGSRAAAPGAQPPPPKPVLPS